MKKFGLFANAHRRSMTTSPRGDFSIASKLSTLATLTTFGALAGLLSACSTLSENECRSANWFEIGYSDASQGYESNRISQHRSACADYGVKTQLDPYLQGYQKGLVNYCSKQQGFELAINGNGYPSQCNPQFAAPVRSGYNAGLPIYNLRQQQNSLQQEYNQTLDDIDQLRSKIDKLQAQAEVEASSRKLHNEIHRLKRRLVDLKWENQQRETQIEQLELRIQKLRQRFYRHNLP